MNISLFGKDKHRNKVAREVKLYRHTYRYFPYEKELARREVQQVAGDTMLKETTNGFQLSTDASIEKLRQLTYTARFSMAEGYFSTLQYELEEAHKRVNGVSKRQATRYSVHGLHEYKGRFNPQIVRFLINYLGATNQTKILDPFCGSGTSLVEAAFQGIESVGIDMNQFAVFLCNAKLCALSIPTSEIKVALKSCLSQLKRINTSQLKSMKTLDSRLSYLEKWFPLDTLTFLEHLRNKIHEHGERSEPILLSLASDLLRDYSLQEPSDLRIRRRISPFPSAPFLNALENKAETFLRSLSASQEVIGTLKHKSHAIVGNSRMLPDALTQHSLPSSYNLIITSPPYATALPYIDTQRLSLVWLCLCSAEEIRHLEAVAVGSRELYGNSIEWEQRLLDNADDIPQHLATFCRELYNALSERDGFRRRAVPSLIYRYFVDMSSFFTNLKHIITRGTRLALVVGSNHTTLGGQRFNIDTPRFLSIIAEDLGFRVSEVITLQTYHRYGLHQKNSIKDESLTILEWS